MPYSPDAEYPQCQLLPEEPVQDLSISAIRGKKIAIQCRTQEEWNQILQILDDEDCKWGSGKEMLARINNWEYGENTCIAWTDGHLGYGQVTTYPDYQIVQASDVIQANTQNNNTMKQTMTPAQELEALRKSQKETADRIAALEEQVRNPYKKGDWVKWTGEGPVVAQIERKSSSANCWVLNVNGNTSSHDSCNIVHLRPATQEEVKKAQTPTEIVVKIGTKQLKVVVRKGNIHADGKNVLVADLKAVIDKLTGFTSMLPWSIDVQTVKVGCCEGVTVQQLQDIVNAYEKINQ
jgi:hypothetical protein